MQSHSNDLSSSYLNKRFWSFLGNRTTLTWDPPKSPIEKCKICISSAVLVEDQLVPYWLAHKDENKQWINYVANLKPISIQYWSFYNDFWGLTMYALTSFRYDTIIRNSESWSFKPYKAILLTLLRTTKRNSQRLENKILWMPGDPHKSPNLNTLCVADFIT